MNKYMIVIALSMLSGCSNSNTESLQSIGGSRAVGIVDIGTPLAWGVSTASIDTKKGLLIALKRCKAWGYKEVEAFGGIIVSQINGVQTATVKYQCLN